MKKIIPERLEVTCDICHNVCVADEYGCVPTRSKSAFLNLHATAVENGVGVGDDSQTWDLCDNCVEKVREAVRSLQ